MVLIFSCRSLGYHCNMFLSGYCTQHRRVYWNHSKTSQRWRSKFSSGLFFRKLNEFSPALVLLFMHMLVAIHKFFFCFSSPHFTTTCLYMLLIGVDKHGPPTLSLCRCIWDRRCNSLSFTTHSLLYRDVKYKSGTIFGFSGNVNWTKFGRCKEDCFWLWISNGGSLLLLFHILFYIIVERT